MANSHKNHLQHFEQVLESAIQSSTRVRKFQNLKPPKIGKGSLNAVRFNAPLGLQNPLKRIRKAPRGYGRIIFLELKWLETAC